MVGRKGVKTTKKPVTSKKKTKPAAKKTKPDIEIGVAEWERLKSLTGLALDGVFAILSGEADATNKEKMDAIKLILSRTLPEKIFVEAFSNQGDELVQLVRIFGVNGLDTDCI